MIRIVTESTADIPAEFTAKLDITVVPSYVMFGSETYRDGIELTKQQFYVKLAASRTIPTTATPSPTVYEEAYRRLSKETDRIVSIHLDARLSGLYSAASVAAQSVPEARIAVIDSQQATMGYGWMAVAAAEAARRGHPGGPAAGNGFPSLPGAGSRSDRRFIRATDSPRDGSS